MLREDLAQLFVFGFDGTNLPTDAEALLNQNAGRGILFGRNIEEKHQLVSLITQIQESQIKRFPPDFCGSRRRSGAAFKNICTYVPTMAEVGQAAKTDNSIPYRLGALMGRELAALGFHLDFTPVMDVNSNPENPVIGERSFSHDPMWVAECGAELIKECKAQASARVPNIFPVMAIPPPTAIMICLFCITTSTAFKK